MIGREIDEEGMEWMEIKPAYWRIMGLGIHQAAAAA